MKKLFSLLLVVAMLASLSLVASAATENVMKTTITETDAGITVVVSVSNPNNVSGALASLNFPSTLTSDKTSYTLGDNFAGLTVSASSKTSNVKYSFSHGSAADFVTATGDVVMISFPLTRTDADAVYTSKDFAYGIDLYAAQLVYNDGTKSVTMKNTNADYAANFAAPEYVDARTVEDKFIEDETVTEGNDVTFYGKVGANYLDQKYGVEVEGVKFYGASNNDTVKDYNGSTTFTFANWDGTFNIVLKDAAQYCTAGTKTFNFFVGENVTDAATFVIE